MKTGPLFLVLFVFAPNLHAQVPSMLAYQGRVQVGAAEFNGSGQFKFALVNPAGTQTIWSNDGTSSSGKEPGAAVRIVVNKGIFSVQLGDTSLPNMTPIPNRAFAQPDSRLRVWFNDGANGFQQLVPDQPIASVGYAFEADLLDGLDASAFALKDHAHANLATVEQFTAFKSQEAALDADIEQRLDAKFTSSGTALQTQISALQTKDADLQTQLAAFKTQEATVDAAIEQRLDAKITSTSSFLQTQVTSHQAQIAQNSGNIAGLNNLIGGDATSTSLKISGKPVVRLDGPGNLGVNNLSANGGTISLNAPAGGGSAINFSNQGTLHWTLLDDVSSFNAFKLIHHGATGDQLIIRADANYFALGTDQPVARLHVQDTAPDLALFRSRSTSGAILTLQQSAPDGGGDSKWTLRARNGQLLISGFDFLSERTAMTFENSGDVQFWRDVKIDGTISPRTAGSPIKLAVAAGQVLQFRYDGNLVPGINVATSGALGGIMRFRNALEVWPNDGGTAAGKIDVRNKSGVATITLNGDNGTITATTVSTSDRNAKENFREINSGEVLAKVASLPIKRWNYKQDPSVEHIGTFAQDFYAAFAVGPDDKHIASIDADGVALAAIQGLNERVQNAEARIHEKDAKIESLEKRLAGLERLIRGMTTQN